MLRQKLSLILPPDAVETLLAMWTGTVQYKAVQEKVKPEDKLEAAAFAGEPSIQVNYDEVGEKQRLTFRGVLLDEKKTQLTEALKKHILSD